MAYVINDGDMPTSRFQQFVDVCCTAYNELRRHTHTLLSLLSLVRQRLVHVRTCTERKVMYIYSQTMYSVLHYTNLELAQCMHIHVNYVYIYNVVERGKFKVWEGKIWVKQEGKRKRIISVSLWQMLSSGLPELSSADDILYVRDALLPGRSDAEATYAFTKWANLVIHLHHYTQVHRLVLYIYAYLGPTHVYRPVLVLLRALQSMQV